MIPFIGRPLALEAKAVFMRQLAALIGAGLPLLRSLEILIVQERNPRFKKVLRALAADMRSGHSFSEALMRHPKSFDALFVHIVRAGEAGGSLARALGYLSRFLEKSVRTRSQIRMALLYPLVVIFISLVVLFFLSLVVVPQFQALFEDMLKGAPLPRPTAWVMGFSNWLHKGSSWLLPLAIFTAIGSTYALRASRVRKLADWICLYLPGIGGLVRKAAMARFSRIVGLLLGNGVSLLQSLEIARDSLGNLYFRRTVDRLRHRLQEGESLAISMGCESLFPYTVASMIGVGEETGDLATMFDHIADDYEGAVDRAATGLTGLLEPLMIILLAVVIGFVVVALFLPIIEIISQLQ